MSLFVHISLEFLHHTQDNKSSIFWTAHKGLEPRLLNPIGPINDAFYSQIQPTSHRTMTESDSQKPRTGRNALVPMVLVMGIGSIVCSEVISAYWGVTLAIVALMITQFVLKDVSRLIWICCVTLATVGFASGLAALLMRMFIDIARRK
jgi:hypothetical protein